MSTSTIIELAVLYALAVVVPLALAAPPRRWLAAAAATYVSFLLPTGLLAAALTLPVAALATLEVVDRARPLLSGGWPPRHPPPGLSAGPGGGGVDRSGGPWPAAVEVLPAVWAVVAAQALATSRGGWVVLGQHEPFVLLTAIHYLYAGVGALTLALRSGNGTAVLATASAPPLIAAGFLFDVAGPLYCGAILLTIGVWSTAGSQLRAAARRGSGRRAARVLLAVSSVAVFAPMVLAVLWALSVRWPGLPHLGIRLMVPFHGLVNAFGFVTCGLLAGAGPRPRPPPAGRKSGMRLDLDLGGLRFGPFTAGDRERLLAEARAAGLSYGPPVGHTLDLDRPMTGDSIDVGSFEGARTALRTWVAHRGVGFEVVPADAPVEVGTTVLVVLRKGPFYAVARNRIVAVVDEPDRFGWAYGTLHGHPEWGEEAFLVERRTDDDDNADGGGAARVTIRTESGPASWAAKLAGPLVHQWQLQALRGYLRAIASAS